MQSAERKSNLSNEKNTTGMTQNPSQLLVNIIAEQSLANLTVNNILYGGSTEQWNG